MFTVMKVREGLAANDYKNPGPYKNPPGTVAHRGHRGASKLGAGVIVARRRSPAVPGSNPSTSWMVFSRSLTRFALRPWSDAAVLAQLDACVGECIYATAAPLAAAGPSSSVGAIQWPRIAIELTKRRERHHAVAGGITRPCGMFSTGSL
jgi:hypothetical protein